MEKRNQGYGFIFSLIIVLLLCTVLVSYLKQDKNYYSKDALLEDIGKTLVNEVVIHPNADNQTGTLEVKFKDG